MMSELKKGVSFSDDTKESRKATFDLESLSVPVDSGHEKSLTLTLMSISVTVELKSSRSGTSLKDFKENDKPTVFLDISNDTVSQRREAMWDCEVNGTEHYKFEGSLDTI